MKRIRTRRKTTMKPPTKLLRMKPRQGTTRPEDPEGDGEEYEDYEVSESEAIALNCLEELEEPSEAGHAVQLHLAAHAAFGKSKGKGKGKSKKGKGKGKGKVVRSHLTLEKRREKLKSLQAKSQCMRCGALGHWAGDPEFKFPTSQDGKGKAHLAIIADEGLSIPSGNESAAAFVVRPISLQQPSLLQRLPMNLEIWSWKEVIRSSIWVSIGMRPTLRLPRR